MTKRAAMAIVRAMALSEAEQIAVAEGLREVIARHKRWRTRFEGGSMQPLIPRGCMLEVAALPARVQLGELLVFVHESVTGVCCHRVIGLCRRDGGQDAALTQGDGVAWPDGVVEPARWVGVVRRVRLGGRWLSVSELGGRPRKVARLLHRAGRRVARAFREKTA